MSNIVTRLEQSCELPELRGFAWKNDVRHRLHRILVTDTSVLFGNWFAGAWHEWDNL